MRRSGIAMLVLVLAGCGAAPEDANTGPTDGDRDGATVETDCDDSNAEIHPGATETAYDGIDQDCDLTDLVDVDGDGYAGSAVEGGDDCDDQEIEVHPLAVELCDDGVDQDCNGGDLSCELVDGDGDGYTPAAGDCDDADANVSPDQIELPYNGTDDDCDRFTRDEDLDVDTYDHDVDCDEANPNVHPGATDLAYDGVDQDCEGGDLVDVDGDGDAAAIVGGPDCNDNDPEIDPSEPEIPYNGVDNDCNPKTPDEDLDGDGRGHLTDCDDLNADRFAGNPEIPYDGIDQNCTGDDLVDVDFDGHLGIPAGGDDCVDTDRRVNPSTPEEPYNGKDDDCDPDTWDDDFDRDGFLLAQDCDDKDAGRYPTLQETPYDGIDQDCTGVDLTDVDLDRQDAAVVGGDDCDDGDDAIYKGAPEIFGDGIDQDCEGHDAVDIDGDLHADVASGGDDCDDTDKAINPKATEICGNAVDEDCSGKADGCLYTFTGVQNDVPEDDLTGWSLCFSDKYGNSGTALPPEDCDGKYILMACRQVGQDNLAVLAYAAYDDVFTVTGGNSTTNSNDVEWYYSDSRSWGFAPDGETVTLNSCDTTNQGRNDRICWHSGNGVINGGWRCGSNTGLNSNNNWERLVYETDEEP